MLAESTCIQAAARDQAQWYKVVLIMLQFTQMGLPQKSRAGRSACSPIACAARACCASGAIVVILSNQYC